MELPGAFLAAVLLCLAPLPQHAHTAAAQTPGEGELQPVVVAVARSADFVDRVEALGTTRANETVRVTANVTEKVAAIHFDDGQQIEAGALLVTLEKAEEEADLKAAEAILAERRLAFERAQQLESRQFTSVATLDERRAAVRESEAALGAIRARIEDRIIRAPFAGVIGLRNISVGALVEPGDLITTLDDLSVIKVDFAVPATYLAALKPGLPIVAKTPAFGTAAFEGEVRSIATQVDPVTRSIMVRALLPNSDGLLRPGLLMSIELLKNPRRAILVPEEALVPQGSQSFVFVVDEANDNTVVRREVAVGARRPGEVEILEGLSEGEKVITQGTLLVRPGQRVTILAVVEEARRPPSSEPAIDSSAGRSAGKG